MAKPTVTDGIRRVRRRRAAIAPDLAMIEGNRGKEQDLQAMDAYLSPDHLAVPRLIIRELFKEMKDGDVPDSFFDEWRDRMARVRQFCLDYKAGCFADVERMAKEA